MSKNKFAWTLALILIALISLPIAYAQEAARPSWFYVLVNTLIIGIVLFMLQAFLVPGKEGKEKTAIWFIVLIASLLIAWFYGSTGFIWQGPLGVFLRIKVLVNAIIIAAALYFLLGLLRIKQPESPQGRTGYGLLLFIIALVFAVRLGNQWVWDAATIRTLVIFFFGPQGILTLNQNRLFIFIGTAVLFSWFFITIGVGKESRAINYMLAIVLAARLATGPSPLSAGGFKLIAMVVGTWVLGGNLADKFTTTKGRVFGYVMALALVSLVIGTIETAISPEARAEAAGRGIFGWIGSIFGFVFSKWIILILIVAALLFVIMRGEEKGRILKEGITRLGVKLLHAIKMNRGLALLFGNLLEVKDPTLTGELTFKLRDLRVQIFNLMNLVLRHEIFKAKAERIHSIAEEFGHIDTGREKELGSHVATPEDIHEHMKVFIDGAKIIKTDDGKWVLEKKEKKGNEDEEDRNDGLGFARQYFLIYGAMEKLKISLEGDLTGRPPHDPSSDAGDWAEDEANSWLGKYEEHISKIYPRYKRAIERFKIVNLVRHYSLYFYDMYNLYGEYVRGARFAKLHAKPDYYEYKYDDNGVQRFIDWDSVKKVGTETKEVTNLEPGTDFLTEVDLYGYSVADINKIQIEREDPEYEVEGVKKKAIRRYKKSDITYLHKATGRSKFAEILDFATKEWDFFVEDMTRCNYHPWSKKIDDYNDIIREGRLDFESATFKRPLEYEDIGFDMEALKHPGKMIYWGRKHYYDETRDSLRLEPQNPYPGYSLLGLWQFVNTVAKKHAKEPEAAKKFLEEYFSLGYKDLKEAGRTQE